MTTPEPTLNRVVVLILTAIFGLFFLAFGVYGVAMEMKAPPLHTTHLFFFGFMVLLGAVLMPGVGTIIFARLKDGVGLAEPFIPRFGRREKSGEVVAAAPAPVGVAAPSAPVPSGTLASPVVTEEHDV
jgi:hypothetical protein